MTAPEGILVGVLMLQGVVSLALGCYLAHLEKKR